MKSNLAAVFFFIMFALVAATRDASAVRSGDCGGFRHRRHPLPICLSRFPEGQLPGMP